MMALQKQGTPPDPCLELEAGLCIFVCHFLLHGFGSAGKQRTAKTPGPYTPENQHNNGKGSFEDVFLLNMGIFHLYLSFPENIQQIVREE